MWRFKGFQLRSRRRWPNQENMRVVGQTPAGIKAVLLGWCLSVILGALSAADSQLADQSLASARNLSPRGSIASVPLLHSSLEGAATLFENLSSSQTGIDLVYHFPTNAP